VKGVFISCVRMQARIKSKWDANVRYVMHTDYCTAETEKPDD